jgi:hypothetical protein
MSRYIDADKLIEKWQNTLKDKSPDDLAYKCFTLFIDGLKEEPTADVVPKSEVDDLRRYIILNEDIAIKCKRENGVQNEEYWKGKISAFKQIRAYIDTELKKKYTESEDKG